MTGTMQLLDQMFRANSPWNKTPRPPGWIGAPCYLAALVLLSPRNPLRHHRGPLTETVMRHAWAWARGGVCGWAQDGDEESSDWVTDCGKSFSIVDGDPFDNEMNYCCYCGKRISVTGLVWDGQEVRYGSPRYQK